MNASEILLENRERQLKEVIDYFVDRCEIAKQQLFNLELSDLKKERLVVFIFIVCQLYKDCAFFPDDKTCKRFEELGFERRQLDRFIDINLVLGEIKRIQSIDGIIIDSLAWMVGLKSYLDLKINADLLQWLKISYKNNEGDRIESAFKEMSNTIRRRNYEGVRPKTVAGEFDLRINELLDSVEPIFGSKGAVQHLNKGFKGNIEKFYLGGLLDDCILYDKIKVSKRHFYFHIAPLLRLFIGDHEFLSEEEFEKGKRAKTSGQYDNDYKKYVESRVNKIIYKR